MVVPGPPKESLTYMHVLILITTRMRCKIFYLMVHGPTKESATCHLLNTIRKRKFFHLMVSRPTKIFNLPFGEYDEEVQNLPLGGSRAHDGISNLPFAEYDEEV